MKVLKFGGTSVGSTTSIQQVTNILASEAGKKIVVVSAMSGVTNQLQELNRLLMAGPSEPVAELLAAIRNRHLELIGTLFQDPEQRRMACFGFDASFANLEEIVTDPVGPVREAAILTMGEIFLSGILSQYLEIQGISNTLLDSRHFMHVASLDNPDITEVRGLLLETLDREVASEVYITQGFVRIDRNKNISTLKRGGSDYSATIIGAAIQADEVQIWTDIDGFHNNDPRFVANTSALEHLTFDEAAELAYFGAKVLHPQTVSPVKELNIPIYLKNTFTPEAPGTKISSAVYNTGLKAISAKDGITAIKIKSNRMLMAHGFLRRIFDVFDRYETAIDMITTSEIAISLTIDDNRHLNSILEELEEYGEITVDKNHSILCVVGEKVIRDKDTFRLFELLKNIPVRMISYGGSSHNISMLVHTDHKVRALRALHQKLFEEKLVTETVKMF